MSDLPTRLTLLAAHLEKKAKLSDALADDHEANREMAEASRMKKRAASARRFATDCVNAAKLLTAKAKRAGFVPPTFNEVIAYAASRPDMLAGWPDKDIRAWFDHFESVGWRVNTKPMVDWKAAAANGYRRWLKENPQKATLGTSGSDPAGWREFLAARGRPYKSFALESGWVRTEFEGRAK